MEVHALLCPQCGSADVRVHTANQATCNSCGANLVLEQSTPNALHTCSVTRLKPEFSREDFLRKAWIDLAQADAPEDVFSLDFAPVEETVIPMLVQSRTIEATYQAGIGYDRQEAYTDYETYYENEPYIDYETYYENGVSRKRQVTKYRKVTKQRPVTKYKTVVDWSVTHGTHHMKSTVCDCNDASAHADVSLFIRSFVDASNDVVEALSPEEAAIYHVSDYGHRQLDRQHNDALYADVEKILPGDHTRDLHCDVTAVPDSHTTIYLATFYRTTIQYNGETYVKYAFPYGNMPMGGNDITNEKDLYAAAKDMKSELESATAQCRKEAEDNIWKDSKASANLALILLGVSIAVSLLLHYMVLVILAFAAAIGGLVWSNSISNKAEERYNKEADDQIAALTEKYNSDTSNYRANYKQHRLEILNNKLESLGLSPEDSLEIRTEAYL